MSFSETVTDSDRAFQAMAFEMCGDAKAAAIWIVQVAELATHIDHVVDGDPLDKARFVGVMLKVLSEWPTNAFYREHAHRLAPVVMNAFTAWEASGTGIQRIKAYDVATEIPKAVAFCLGGEPMARQWAPKWHAWAASRCAENDRKETVWQQ